MQTILESYLQLMQDGQGFTHFFDGIPSDESFFIVGITDNAINLDSIPYDVLEEQRLQASTIYNNLTIWWWYSEDREQYFLDIGTVVFSLNDAVALGLSLWQEGIVEYRNWQYFDYIPCK